MRSRRSLRAAAPAAVLAALLFAAPAWAAETGGIGLEPNDLPGDFRTVVPSELTDVSASLGEMGEGMSEALPGAELLGTSILATEAGDDLIFTFVVGPLPEDAVAEFDAMLEQDEAALEDIGTTPFALGVDFTEPALLDTEGVADGAVGFFTVGTVETGGAVEDAYLQNLVTGVKGDRGVIEFVIALQGDAMLIVGVIHIGEGDPAVGAAEATELLAREVGGGGYRATGPLAPELTTYIPTPVDISTDPKVVGTNLLLAAIATVAFTVALRLLNTSLAAHEGELERVFPPARWFAEVQGRLDRRMQAGVGNRADILRIVGILLFYGVVFSLLEPGWNPFTVTGLALLVYMTVAFGLVGIVDDLAAWFQAKRWGLPARMAIRPALALLAVTSTVTTRLFGIVPGIMIGTPDAFPVEKGSLEASKEQRLVHVGAAALLVTGIGAWALSAVAELLLGAGVAETLVAGVQAFVLVVFAVTVQNLFMQMVALRGSIGGELYARNRWLWIGAFAAVTFVFLTTLLNPRGDVAEALTSANVIVFLVTSLLFVAASTGIWFAFRRLDRAHGVAVPSPVATAPPRPAPVAAHSPVGPPSPPVIVPVPPRRDTATPPVVSVPTSAPPVAPEASLVLRPSRMGRGRRPCAVGSVWMASSSQGLVVDGDFVDRDVWVSWFLRTTLLVLIGVAVAVAGAALGVWRADESDVAAVVALVGLAIGIALFAWGVARTLKGPHRLAAAGRLVIPYERIAGIDLDADVVRLTVRWYPQDVGPIEATFAVSGVQDPAAFCTALFVARAHANASTPPRVPQDVH